MDDRTVHNRPPGVLQVGTQVTVDAKVCGIDVGAGLYGEADRTLNLTIGPYKIATVDDTTKRMIVTIDGQVARRFSSAWAATVDQRRLADDLVTGSGNYVAQEKYDVKQMNSGSYGPPTSYDLGYDSVIPLGVRLSNSGILAPSARGPRSTRRPETFPRLH